MPKQSEILKIAFRLTTDCIMKPKSFNPDIAAASLQIFIRASRQDEEISAAQAVLAALDHLSSLSWEDHRSRLWQESKILVQEAFGVLKDVYDDASVKEYVRKVPTVYSTRV